jgi:poly(A) polymerase
MYKYKLLQEIFPELKNIANANKQYYFHTGGLLHHLFETMKAMEHILNNLSIYFPDSYTNLQEHFDNNIAFSEYVTRRSLLKFVALFHDNAKPETISFKNNKMHFIGHEHIGAIKIKQLMTSMKFGKKDIEFAMFLIKNHMRPSNLTKISIMTKKSILKFFRDVQDRTPDLLVLSMADWYSYKVVKEFSIKSLELQEYNVKTLLNHYYKLNNIVQLKKIIDGNVIMKKFHLGPGPYIGKLLKFIENARDEGLITTTEEALEVLKTKIESKLDK